MTDEVFIKFGGDASGAVDASRRTEQALAQVSETIRRQNAQMAKSSDLVTNSFQQSADQINKLLDRYDQQGARLRELTADFHALNSAAMGGEIGTSNEGRYEMAMSKIKAEMDALKSGGGEAGSVVKHAMEDAAEGASALGGMTVRARSEMIVMAHEALQGRFSRMPGSFMVLAESMGSVGHEMLVIAGYAAVVVGSIALLAKAFYDAEEEAIGFSRAIDMTSNYAGVTADSMTGLAHDVANSTGQTIGSMKEMVTQLVASGQISQQALGQVAEVTAQYAQATGEDVDKLTPKLIAMFKDPSRAAESLNSSMHFLSVTELEHIRNLEEMGNREEAQVALAQALKQHFDSMSGSLEMQIGVWHRLKDAMSGFWDKLEHDMHMAFGDTTQLERLQAELQHVNLRLDASDGSDRSALSARKLALEKEISDLQGQAAKRAQEQAAAAQKNAREQAAYDEARKSRLGQIQEIENKIQMLQGVHLSGQSETERLDRIKELQQQIQTLQKKDAGPQSHGTVSLVTVWKQQLEDMKMAEGAFDQNSIQMEVKFWQEKLSKLKTGTKEYAAVRAQLQQAEKTELRQSVADKSTEMRTEIADARAGSVEKIRLAGEYAAYIRSVYGENSAQYKAALHMELAAARQNAQEQLRIKNEQVQQSLDADLHGIEMKKANDELLLAQGRLTKQKLYEDEIQYEDMIYAARLKALNESMNLMDKETLAYAQSLRKKEQLEQQHQLSLEKIRAKAAIEQQKEQAKQWKSLEQTASTLWNQGIQAMMNGTLTWNNATRAIGASLVQWFARDVVGKQVMATIFGENAKTSAVVAGTAARQAAETESAGQSLLAHAGTAIKEIINDSMKVFAGIFGFLAPEMGPAAAAPAAAASGTVAALAGSVMSAAGGAWRVPSDQLAFIHKDEQVWPAWAAQGVRDMMQNGGNASNSAGDVHLHVHTMDVRGVKEWFRKNSAAMAPGLRNLSRNFTPVK